MDSLFRTAFPFLVPALMSLTGCSSPQAGIAPAEVEKLRAKLTLADEPDGVKTVSEVRLAMLGEAAPDVLGLIEDADGHAGHDHAGESADHAEEHADEGAEHEAEGHEGHKHYDPVVSDMDVVLVGVVGGIPNPSEQSLPEFPFAKGKAMFFLADPEAVAELEEHGHQHAPGEECSFCAAHAAEASALVAGVIVADESGKLLPVDARELFDLKDKDVVVVRGKAHADAHGTITVAADGVYVRR
jgi:hypothetical protein